MGFYWADLFVMDAWCREDGGLVLLELQVGASHFLLVLCGDVGWLL